MRSTFGEWGSGGRLPEAADEAGRDLLGLWLRLWSGSGAGVIFEDLDEALEGGDLADEDAAIHD